MSSLKFNGTLPRNVLDKKRFNILFPFSYRFARPKTPSIRNPFTSRFRLASLIALLLLFIYLLGCTWMFFAWALPEAEGIGHIRIGADSATYYAIANAIESGKMPMAFLSLTQNLLGPIPLILLLKNAYLIALFNLGLFLIALQVASTIKGLQFHVFTLWVLFSAETMSALTTVNKEIFALFSAVLFAKYVESRSKILLIIVLVSAVMARWEQAAIVLLFLFLEKVYKRKPARAMVAVTLAMTVAVPIVYRHINPDVYQGYIEGGRTMVVFDSIQAHFGYFLVVIPKTIMNLMGNVAAPWTYFPLWANGFSDAQNQILIREHEVAMTCLMAWALFRRKITIHSPIILFIGIYLFVTSANMFVQSRYVYPVYVLLAIEVAKRRQDAAHIPPGLELGNGKFQFLRVDPQS